jgi:hypothetical protein
MLNCNKKNKWRTFQNETIDTTQLPKFEEVQFSILDSDYGSDIAKCIFLFFNNGGVGLGYCCFQQGDCWFLVGISAAYFLFLFFVCYYREWF